MSEVYLTPEEVMDRLNITRSTLYRRVNDGTLPEPLKLGHLIRFKESEVNSAMELLSARRTKNNFDAGVNS